MLRDMSDEIFDDGLKTKELSGKICLWEYHSTVARDKLQSRTKFIKQLQEIKQNWAGRRNFGINFCIILGHYYQNFISGRDTGERRFFQYFVIS